MKLYYIDRKTQIEHFHDMSIIENLSPLSTLSLTIPASEDFVIQIAAVPDNEHEITAVDCGDIVCINTDITDKFGKSFKKTVPLEANAIQPLFFIVPANEEHIGKTINSEIVLSTDKSEISLPLSLTFTDEAVENNGYNDIKKLSRLTWLNSTRYLDNTVLAPYTVPQVDGNTVKLLGHDIVLGENALPKNIYNYYDEGVNVMPDIQKALLNDEMTLSFGSEKVDYELLKISQDNGLVTVITHGKSDNLSIDVKCKIRYTGAVDYSYTVTALNDVTLDNIIHKTSLSPDCTDYINGLGAVGGKSKSLHFRWNTEKHHDCLFVGSVNAGIQIKWKAEKYVKPLINIYYKNLPLVVSEETWANYGEGTVSFNKETSEITTATGKFTMQKGETRHFDFTLHLTPVKPIDYKKHYSTRYSHSNHLTDERKEVDRAAENGLNNVVIHHGNMVHPFINYPFIETERLKALVDYAATKNIGVKVYYTTREHSNHMAEVFAYKALGDEIILRKKGNGISWQNMTSEWLTEYFGETIIPAWQVHYKKGKYKNDHDVSFIVRPNSRLDNYYVEGLDWLVKNIGIKGIYIDDTALDSTTLERAKKVLLQNDGLIDMHMWNHEEERAGDVSCMNLYIELFPFLDSLWIGEGYPYKKLSPDYLLTEVSGIPYGQTSQMLEGGGDPFLGMIYGMNNRFGWSYFNALFIYELWDNFGIEESEMLGYWHSKNPVSTGDENVLATVYKKDNSALVCLFNFSDKKHAVNLKIDENLLGFHASSCERVYIKKTQRKKKVNLEKSIKLKGKKGIILLLKK